MRFLNTLKNDIHFQVRYGFYFLYAFFSIVYIAVLMLVHAEYKTLTASLIVLTDPAMLGIFFIGGIWLLEKGEGLHSFWIISPLCTVEYILSKAVSLALLSTLSADLILLISMRSRVQFLFLSASVFAGAVTFNLIGLMAASCAHSVNQYMLIAMLPSIFLAVPPVLTAFLGPHPLLELFPGTALWHLIAASLGSENGGSLRMWGNLILWFMILLFPAKKRIGTALKSEGGRRL